MAEDISVSLSGGELVCLLGPNGAGKSTLLRTVSGIKGVSKLLSVSPGFNIANRMVVDVVLPATQYKDDNTRTTFYRELFRRLSGTTGLEAAGGSLFLTLVVKTALPPASA